MDGRRPPFFGATEQHGQRHEMDQASRAQGLDARDYVLHARQALSLCPKPRERRDRVRRVTSRARRTSKSLPFPGAASVIILTSAGSAHRHDRDV